LGSLLPLDRPFVRFAWRASPPADAVDVVGIERPPKKGRQAIVGWGDREAMSRSLKKGPYVDQRLLAKVERQDTGHREPIKTWSRDSTIVPEMIGFTFLVHNGPHFMTCFVTEHLI